MMTGLKQPQQSLTTMNLLFCRMCFFSRSFTSLPSPLNFSVYGGPPISAVQQQGEQLGKPFSAPPSLLCFFFASDPGESDVDDLVLLPLLPSLPLSQRSLLPSRRRTCLRHLCVAYSIQTTSPSRSIVFLPSSSTALPIRVDLT
jgi:hypothetical protein